MGTFLTLKHAAPRLAAAGGGSYVAISSHAGRDTFRFLGAYGAAKAGMDFLVRVAADELGPARVRVNSVLPGIIDDEIMTGITAGGPVLDSYHSQIPLWRVGTVDDVAALVRFLVGPESAWITGQNISVDGGQSVRGGADFSAVRAMLPIPPTRSGSSSSSRRADGMEIAGSVARRHRRGERDRAGHRARARTGAAPTSSSSTCTTSGSRRCTRRSRRSGAARSGCTATSRSTTTSNASGPRSSRRWAASTS